MLVGLARRRLIRSAHDVSHGGLAVTLAECCISGEREVGVEVELLDDVRPDALLFGEDQGRVVVSLEPGREREVQVLAREYEVPFRLIGSVGGRVFKLSWPGGVLEIPVGVLKDTWDQGFTKHI